MTHPTTPPADPEGQNDLVLSFLAVRRALGMLGFFLPTSLILLVLLTDEVMRPSISEFYHSTAGDLFVGTLCAIAVFLWSYVGYPPQVPGEWPSDRLVSRVAAVAALGVALFPTADKALAGLPQATAGACTLMQCLIGDDMARRVHYGSAAVFFLCLALFCLVLFRRTGGRVASRGKRGRNRIYAGCGWTILACIALLAAYGLGYRMQDDAGRAAYDATRAVFILESVAVFAFALSWLVKGETLKPLQRMVEPRAG
jgi:hypothetical protein